MFNNNNDGPTLIDPPKPTPYYTCLGCKHYESAMTCSGGIRGAPTYHKYCLHPTVMEKNDILELAGASHGPSNFGELLIRQIVTPTWCPYLQNNLDETQSNKEE